MKPHGGENHLLGCSLLFTLYFYSAIMNQDEKTAHTTQTDMFETLGELFSLLSGLKSQNELVNLLRLFFAVPI